MRPNLAATLHFIGGKLSGLRFAGLNQNPHGIRDLLASCAIEAQRNERLHDAAPDMLAALKEAEDELRRCGLDCVDSDERTPALLGVISAAIAKADGRT